MMRCANTRSVTVHSTSLIEITATATASTHQGQAARRTPRASATTLNISVVTATARTNSKTSAYAVESPASVVAFVTRTTAAEPAASTTGGAEEPGPSQRQTTTWWTANIAAAPATTSWSPLSHQTQTSDPMSSAPLPEHAVSSTNNVLACAVLMVRQAPPKRSTQPVRRFRATPVGPFASTPWS